MQMKLLLQSSVTVGNRGNRGNRAVHEGLLTGCTIDV
jgi:hypothetical protein